MPAGPNPSLCAPLGFVWLFGRQRGGGARAAAKRALFCRLWRAPACAPDAGSVVMLRGLPRRIACGRQGSARKSRFPTLLIADDGKICKDGRRWEPGKPEPGKGSDRRARAVGCGRSAMVLPAKAGVKRTGRWARTRRPVGRHGRPTCCQAIGTNARSHAPQVTCARTPRRGIAAARARGKSLPIGINAEYSPGWFSAVLRESRLMPGER